MFFINNAFAENVENQVQAGNFQNFTASLVPLLIFIAVFYFLLIRPQQKKQQEHEKEVASLKPNDNIITAGGIFAIIKKVKENTLIIEVADGVEMEILSETVSLAKNLEAKNKTEDKEVKKETKKKNKKEN